MFYPFFSCHIPCDNRHSNGVISPIMMIISPPSYCAKIPELLPVLEKSGRWCNKYPPAAYRTSVINLL